MLNQLAGCTQHRERAADPPGSARASGCTRPALTFTVATGQAQRRSVDVHAPAHRAGIASEMAAAQSWLRYRKKGVCIGVHRCASVRWTGVSTRSSCRSHSRMSRSLALPSLVRQYSHVAGRLIPALPNAPCVAITHPLLARPRNPMLAHTPVCLPGIPRTVSAS